MDICRIYGKPSIDLFATHINTQLPLFFLWKPDPEALVTDEFSIPWNNDYFLYGFPPFRVIENIVRKQRGEKAFMLAILPVWRTQLWFAETLRLLKDVPQLLPP